MFQTAQTALSARIRWNHADSSVMSPRPRKWKPLEELGRRRVVCWRLLLYRPCADRQMSSSEGGSCRPLCRGVAVVAVGRRARASARAACTSCRRARRSRPARQVAQMSHLRSRHTGRSSSRLRRRGRLPWCSSPSARGERPSRGGRSAHRLLTGFVGSSGYRRQPRTGRKRRNPADSGISGDSPETL